MKMDAAGNLIVTDSPVSFEAIFKQHFKSLHIYACSITKNDAIAEEIVQNVFYKLWERKEQLPETQSLAAYLYRSVHNECLNHLKHSKVKTVYQAYIIHNNRDQDNLHDPLAIRELQQRIDMALHELPEQCRTIFQLSRFEDLKYRDIADKLGISTKTVENQMGKALKVLRVKLAEFLPLLLILTENILS